MYFGKGKIYIREKLDTGMLEAVTIQFSKL